MIALNLEGGCHASECTHTDRIDGEHKNDREVDLGVLRSPGKEEYHQILDGEKTAAYD